MEHNKIAVKDIRSKLSKEEYALMDISFCHHDIGISSKYRIEKYLELTGYHRTFMNSYPKKILEKIKNGDVIEDKLDVGKYIKHVFFYCQYGFLYSLTFIRDYRKDNLSFFIQHIVTNKEHRYDDDFDIDFRKNLIDKELDNHANKTQSEWFSWDGPNRYRDFEGVRVCFSRGKLGEEKYREEILT